MNGITQYHPSKRVPISYVKGGVVWRDKSFSLIGRNLDTSSGRIGYNYTENMVFFGDNARYAATEQISVSEHINHDWLQGSYIRPHVHWAQSAAGVPNMVLGYRFWDNGGTIPSEWGLSTPAAHLYTYTSGALAQMTLFPIIDLSSLVKSSPLLQFKLWRDTDLASTKYTEADPLTGNWLVAEIDYHYQSDQVGSATEY